MKMDGEGLKQFLLDSNQSGYASGDEEKCIKETDGSTTIPFAKGEWRSHDNFFGGEPYGGRVIVFYRNKPVWIMVYYGRVLGSVEPDLIYEFLRKALMRMSPNAPFRGPAEYKEGELTYMNSWNGNIESFSGEEEINKDSVTTYKASYVGGLVDQRGGL